MLIQGTRNIYHLPKVKLRLVWKNWSPLSKDQYMWLYLCFHLCCGLQFRHALVRVQVIFKVHSLAKHSQSYLWQQSTVCFILNYFCSFNRAKWWLLSWLLLSLVSPHITLGKDDFQKPVTDGSEMLQVFVCLSVCLKSIECVLLNIN